MNFFSDVSYTTMKDVTMVDVLLVFGLTVLVFVIVVLNARDISKLRRELDELKTRQLV